MPSVILHDQAGQYIKKRPTLAPGYTVRVYERIREGEKERTQVFEGLVINIHKGHTATDGSFTVRRVASGVGVERIFPFQSPAIEKIEVKRVAKVRRAKLFFLRGRTGKAARMTERMTSAGEFDVAEDEPMVPETGTSEVAEDTMPMEEVASETETETSTEQSA